jgi:hypothetical protein
MVPKIAHVKNQIKYIIASIAIIAANSKEWFIGHVSSIFVVADRGYYELLFSSVLIGTLLSLVKFADALINSSEIVRRLVMGRQHIEGEWIDTVFLRGGPVGFAVLMISFDGEKYLVTGQDYDMSLNFAGGFTPCSHIRSSVADTSFSPSSLLRSYVRIAWTASSCEFLRWLRGLGRRQHRQECQ